MASARMEEFSTFTSYSAPRSKTSCSRVVILASSSTTKMRFLLTFIFVLPKNHRIAANAGLVPYGLFSQTNTVGKTMAFSSFATAGMGKGLKGWDEDEFKAFKLAVDSCR